MIERADLGGGVRWIAYGANERRRNGRSTTREMDRTIMLLSVVQELPFDDKILAVDLR